MTASLSSFRPPRRTNCKVVSLLGGIVAVHQTNPIDYTWRLANQLGAECYMFLAPLLVDSIETKRNLIEKCGLDTIYRLAENLDLAIVSCGDIGPHSTSLSEGWISKAELQQLIDAGCVCDTMFNFLDRDGNSVDHSINRRVMSVDLDTLKEAKHIVLSSGGAHRAVAIRATIKRIGCNTLITDESAARALLELAEASPSAISPQQGKWRSDKRRTNAAPPREMPSGVRRFPAKHRPLAGEAPVVARQGAVLADRPVAGTTKEIGFAPTAAPTARCAVGRPISLAISE